jgi:hypothetical protein
MSDYSRRWHGIMIVQCDLCLRRFDTRICRFEYPPVWKLSSNFLPLSVPHPKKSRKFHTALLLPTWTWWCDSVAGEPFSDSYKGGTGWFDCTIDWEEEAVSLSIETHDLQEILAGTDRYPQRLGNIDPGCERSCSLGRGVGRVPQPYEASSKANNHSFLF